MTGIDILAAGGVAAAALFAVELLKAKSELSDLKMIIAHLIEEGKLDDYIIGGKEARERNQK